MAILLVIASNTGNTKTFINFLRQHSNQEIEVCTDFKASLKDYEKIAFGTYSWGNGKIPKRLKDFLIENHHDLQGKEVFIFGSGLSVYPKFCGAVDGVNKICSDSGALVKGIFKFEQRFNLEEYLPQEIEELIKIIKDWSA